MLEEKAIKQRIVAVNERIALIKNTGSKSVKRLMKDIHLSSGKRVRALLVLLFSELNGTRINTYSLNVAAAMEMLHSASLIHDDIIDNADMRRGKPALNKKLGGHLSVLAGDLLLSYVTKILLERGDMAIFRIFADTVRDICEGEIEEVYNKNNSALSMAKYIEIIDKKTASLIEASAVSGAIVGGISKKQLRYVSEFGKNIGIAFQIKDDLLDVTGNEATLGKPIGNDIQEGKMTMPLLLALKNTNENEAKIIREMFAGNAKGKYTSKIIKFIIENRGAEDADRAARGYAEVAKKALEKITVKSEQKKALLLCLAEYVVDRIY
ncbi:MAG: polyprenyl synthetase family protein [bacterium]